MRKDAIYREDAIQALERLSACKEHGAEIGTDEETYIGKYEVITEISDIPAVEVVSNTVMLSNGTFCAVVKDASKVRRVLVADDNHWGTLYYPEEKPKRGEWVEAQIRHYPGYECSLCHYGVQPWNNTNFCPNCGADMRKGTDDEEVDVL